MSEQCNVKPSISSTFRLKIKQFVHLFNYECQNHAYKIWKRAEILFLWRSYKILLHFREITRFVRQNNEAFESDDNKGFESKHSPVKILCLPESMRNRANAMNFNKKVVTEVICVKCVVFQKRHCLTFLYGYIFTSN